jgi:hypothetical protein
MAQEHQPAQSLFLDEYPVPENQLMSELELVETFSAAFPQSDGLIEEALTNLSKVTGNHTSVETMNEEAEALEEARLAITNPGARDDSGFRYPTLDELGDCHYDDGYYVSGKMPAHTIALLHGMYGLIGAETIRDDKSEGETDGLVVRRGIYHGETVYAVEQFDHSEQDTALECVRLCSEDGIDRYWNQLAASERQHFLEVSGITTLKYHDAIRTHGVTRDNYEQIAEDLGWFRSETKRLGRKMLADEVELALNVTKAAVGLPLEAGKLCVDRMLSPFKHYWEGKRA